MKKTITTVCMMVFFATLAYGETSLTLDTLSLKDGSKYQQVKITKKDNESVWMLHSYGLSKVGYEELPDNVAKKLGFEPLDQSAYKNKKLQIEEDRLRQLRLEVAARDQRIASRAAEAERVKQSQDKYARALESLRLEDVKTAERDRERARQIAEELEQNRKVREQQAAQGAAAWAARAGANQARFARLPEDGRTQDSDLEIVRRNQQSSEIELRQLRLQREADLRRAETPTPSYGPSAWHNSPQSRSSIEASRISDESRALNDELNSLNRQPGRASYDRRQEELEVDEIEQRQQQLEWDLQRHKVEMETERYREIQRKTYERFDR